LLGPPADQEQADVLNEGLRQALLAFPDEVNPADETASTKSALARVETNATQLTQQGWIPWKEWVYLSNLKPGAESSAAAESVKRAAAAFGWHPGLRAQTQEAVDLVFGIAADSLDEYDRYKQGLGVLDFVDQEVLALRLLEDPAVQEILQAELDLVLLDEFQDTSPHNCASLQPWPHWRGSASGWAIRSRPSTPFGAPIRP
jgi:ATP-dependent helicase/nuclease subunit A